MKKLALLFTGVVTCSLLGLSSLQAAFVSTNSALVQFAITAALQTTNSGVYTTNNATHVATAPYAVTKVKIASQDILNFLQAEFGTTFPPGAQLGYKLTSPDGFVVLDQNGGIILNVTTNPADSIYVFSLSNSVAGAYVPSVETGTAVEKLTTTNLTYNFTQMAPDYGVYYSDKNGNSFHFIGMLTLKFNLVRTPTNAVYKTISFTIPGTGGGAFFNKADSKYDRAVFTSAQISATGAGIKE